MVPAIYQNGIAYVPKGGGFGVTASFSVANRSGLLAEDFRASPLNPEAIVNTSLPPVPGDLLAPDFSATGAPIRFGILIGNSRSGMDGGITTFAQFDIDDVSFTLTLPQTEGESVPTPAATVIGLIGLAVVFSSRRRRG